MLRIGPSGNSLGFYESGHKHTEEAAEWLHSIGLTAYEYSFGRGVRITDETAEKIARQMKKYDIALSVHAPYYTNFANPDPTMIAASAGYIDASIAAMKKLGGTRVVFHPASCGKLTREEAVALTERNVADMMDAINAKYPDGGFLLCPETMGKLNQIGTAEEIVALCRHDEKLVPCFDFGHINSYTRGGIKGKDDYKRLIDLVIDGLGFERGKRLHIHFSKIMYGASGEIKHLTLADEQYGPEYAPLAEVIDEYRLEPVIICESKEIMAEDALIMKKCHKNV